MWNGIGVTKTASWRLADAPLGTVKMCIYTDSWDGNFLIGRHPEVVGLTVATGDSGHGFKFGRSWGG